MVLPRKGQAPAKLEREAFHWQFSRSFADPAFIAVKDALAVVEQVAWDNYAHSHKAPLTQQAGAGFADPITRCPLSGKPRVTACWPPRLGRKIPPRRRAYC